MSVSQGTKNLKFMQRASARTGTSTATEPTRKLLPGEASAQWTLPVAAQPVVAKGKGKSAMKIVYERSYMPFLLGDEAENAEAGPSRPSGRVQFGKKAEEVKVSGDRYEHTPFLFIHILWNSRLSLKTPPKKNQHNLAKKANKDSVSAKLKRTFLLLYLHNQILEAFSSPPDSMT